LDNLRVLRADWLACYHRRGAQDGKQVLFHRVAHKSINSCGPSTTVQRPATFLPNPDWERPEYRDYKSVPDVRQSVKFRRI
jgi:hypothetical protein